MTNERLYANSTYNGCLWAYDINGAYTHMDTGMEGLSMNRQDVYTKVRTHLLAQGERATDEYGCCQYRGEGGRKCAIGCLIPDSLYSESFEGEGASELPQAIYDYLGVNYEEAIQKYTGDGGKDDGDLGFLIGLQNIHDCFDADEWEMCLGDFASAWELSV